MKAGLETYAFTTVHSHNFDHYREINRFVKKELGAHSLFYQYIPQMKDDPLMIPPNNWHELKKWVLLEENISHMNFVRDFFMLSGNACSGGNFVFTVKVDGSVQPCPFINNIALGNIKNNSIWWIFRKRFRNKDLVEFKSTPPECTDCALESVCGGGCKVGNDKQFGHYNCRDMKGKDKIMEDIPTFF
ncbi:MAG TPA: radical SAM protein [Bacteroides sp.]|nr:radical SAM protein [Bacteroides sp.]